MSKLQKDSLMITHDEEIGVVYYPAKGAVSTTTPRHAQVMEQVWQDYLEDRLSQEDRAAFEGYVERSFADKPDLPMMKYTNLLETRTLGRLEILVANKCNLNCRYCYAHGGDYDCESQVLTPESAKKYLRALFSERYISVDVVMLFGGEPTIAPDTIRTICEFFEQYSSLGLIEKMPIFTMVTNGTLIDEDLAQTLKKYDVRVTVSVDGPPEINDQLRVDKAGNGTFAKIERGIRLLQEVGNPPKMIEATYTTLHHKIGYTKADIRKYFEEYFDLDNILVANCTPNGYDDALAYKAEDISSDNDEKNNKPAVLNLRQDLSKPLFSDLACSAGTSSFALTPKGELYPCHKFMGIDEFCIARFVNGVFNFGGYSEVQKRLSAAHKCQDSGCNECWAKALCGACPATMLLHKEQGDFHDLYCGRERQCERQLMLEVAKKEIAEKEGVQA